MISHVSKNKKTNKCIFTSIFRAALSRESMYRAIKKVWLRNPENKFCSILPLLCNPTGPCWLASFRSGEKRTTKEIPSR